MKGSNNLTIKVKPWKDEWLAHREAAKQGQKWNLDLCSFELLIFPMPQKNMYLWKDLFKSVKLWIPTQTSPACMGWDETNLDLLGLKSVNGRHPAKANYISFFLQHRVLYVPLSHVLSVLRGGERTLKPPHVKETDASWPATLWLQHGCQLLHYRAAFNELHLKKCFNIYMALTQLP